MFADEELLRHLQENPTVSSRLKVIAEWNLNTPDNLAKVGNYRFRPAGSIVEKYTSLNNSYDPYDSGHFYTNATDSDIALDGVSLSDDVIEIFSEKKDFEGLLYSLEDCLGRFRPRSGINKVRYGITKFVHHDSVDLVSRPRYYMADKKDLFKYWTSYRNESAYLHNYSDNSSEYSHLPSFFDPALGKTIFGQNLGSLEYGVSNKTVNGINFIDDAAPFVVYKNEVPANRIVVKMQTNVGGVDLGTISSSSGLGGDPLFSSEYKTVPSIWKIQYLKDNVWVDAISFSQFDKRVDGSDIVPNDGYVEVAYGAIVPEQFRANFKNLGTVLSETQLPAKPAIGDAYLVKPSLASQGLFYVAGDDGFSQENSFVPTFGWTLVDESNSQNFLVTKIVDPYYSNSSMLGEAEYNEFVNISGIRIVAEAMLNRDTTLDIIEMSPRLAVDLSPLVASFSVNKNMSDLGVSGLPVGQLLASVGSLDLFDSENAFNKSNPDSILTNIQTKNAQFKIIESIDVVGVEHNVPIKTLYTDSMPVSEVGQDKISIELRDLFFYFESIKAPEIFVTNVSLSYAVSLLLDYAGFSNYTFKRLDTENDPVIPYFYTNSEANIAEVLSDLARSSQYAMYFDEYNNFVVASKGYILPSAEDREIDYTFTSDITHDNGTKYPDIIELSSVSKDVFTGGELRYNSRYIQKSEASARQTYMLSKDKTWVYKPSLLWEVSASPNVRATNEAAGTQAAYSLSAIPLNSDLTDQLPQVINGQLVNNILDVGEGIYWISRYSGYFYANAEIIRFDAVEYSVSGISGNVWLSSVDEYQYYFSKLPFNGKMYPTGRVRIFAEPYYDEYEGQSTIRNGEVRRHGRAQFGTTVAYHSAGINKYWSDGNNVRGFSMKSQYLFGSERLENNLQILNDGVAGAKTPTNKDVLPLAKQSKRSGIIKNYIANFFDAETDSKSKQTINNDMLQSSAFVFEGPELASEDSPVGFISYVPKILGDRTVYTTYDSSGKQLVAFRDSNDVVGYASHTNSLFRHFGTRMRIVGELKNNTDLYQAASGATAYYDTESTSPTVEGLVSGGGGGIAVMLNRASNTGYYFEIAALNKGAKSSDSLTLDDVFFYKVQRAENGDALPILLWSGTAGITVDSGRMTGQSRVFAQDIQTVYDLALEYVEGTSRTFYLYLNGTQIATVIDENPLPIYPDMALFVRGASKCMFENMYALKSNYSKNALAVIDASVSDSFAAKDITVNDSFNKYAISGIVQQSFLSGISPNQVPDWGMYYEEFGTIMREAAYFNVRYDKAFPALYSKIIPTGNEIKGYTVSGYRGTSYGAEFLVFNATDTTIVLDENSGNFLKIQGIAFTQNTSHKLSVDDYFGLTSDLSPSSYAQSLSAGSELKSQRDFEDIKVLRRLYGNNDFSIEAEYIQTHDQATEIMGWLTKTVMRPRLSIGINIYPNPLIQLGDLVSINYNFSDESEAIDNQKRFIVYSIEYNYDNGPSMTVYVSEVD